MDLYKFINPLNILFLVSLISPYKVPYLVLYLTFPNLHAHFFSLYNFFASSLSLLLVPLLLQPLSSSPPRLCRDTANLINSVWASLSRVKSYPSRNLCIIPFKTVFLHRACMAISPTKQGFLWGKLRSREVSRRFWDETSHVAFIRRAKWREEEKEYQEAVDVLGVRLQTSRLRCLCTAFLNDLPSTAYVLCNLPSTLIPLVISL